MTRVLLVYAHCDDELVMGAHWLLDRSLSRRVLICSDDSTNPARQAYRRGPEALETVCRDVGAEAWRTIPFHSEFYRLPARGKDRPLLKDWWDAATAAVQEMMDGCDFIVTDNEWGTYGHMDHLLVRRMVDSVFPRPPIKCTTSWYRTSTWPVCGPECTNGDVHLDMEEIERLKQHYVSRGAWTWDHPIPNPVMVLEAWRNK